MRSIFSLVLILVGGVVVAGETQREVMIFFGANCPYCDKQIEAVKDDQYFAVMQEYAVVTRPADTAKNPQWVEHLKIDRVPQVVVVETDSETGKSVLKNRFQSGFVPIQTIMRKVRELYGR